DAATKMLGSEPPRAAASASYPALSAGVTFTTAPFDRAIEMVGPLKARLFVSSSTPDMDIFATVCAFDPQGAEMTFIGARAEVSGHAGLAARFAAQDRPGALDRRPAVLSARRARAGRAG